MKMKRCLYSFIPILTAWVVILCLTGPALADWVPLPDTNVSVTQETTPQVDDTTTIKVTLKNLTTEAIFGDLRLLVLTINDTPFPVNSDGIMGEDGANPTPYYSLTTDTGLFEPNETITVSVIFNETFPEFTLTAEVNDASVSRDIFRKNVSKEEEMPSTGGLVTVMPVYVDAQNTKGEKLCVNTEAADSKSLLIPCGPEAVCYTVPGDPTSALTDCKPARVKPIIITYDQEVAGTEFNSVPDYMETDEHGTLVPGGKRLVRDIYTAVSLDDGATWKRKNISRTATKSSFTLANGVQYPGDSEKANIAVAGPYALVTWVDKYCRSGNPWDMLAENDIYQVMGSQASVDYLDVKGDDEPRPDLGERPFSCVMAARGVLEMNPKMTITNADGSTTIIDNPNFGTVTWYKAEQLSVGRRDAYQNFTAGFEPVFDASYNPKAGTGGFAVSWQEDKEGLKTGKGRGPGAGMSGSCVNHKTDIWYSYISWDKFDDIDTEFVPSEGGDDAVPTPTGDTGGNTSYICTCGYVYDPFQHLDENGDPIKFTDLPEDWIFDCGHGAAEFEKATKPHALHAMSPPVRVTDNDVCKDRTPTDVWGHLHDPAIIDEPVASCTYTYEGGTTRQPESWDGLGDDWVCPRCGGAKDTFVYGVIKTKHVGLPFCNNYAANPRMDKDGKYVDSADPAYDYANYCLNGSWVDITNPATVLGDNTTAVAITDGKAFISGTQVVWTGEVLDGNTGASRANIALTNWKGETLAVMAYEETKGEGAGSTEKVTKAPEQLAPVPLEVLAVDAATGAITDYLGPFNNGDCVSCHYNHVVPRDRIIPVFDETTCTSKGATWDDAVTGYWPYTLNEDGSVATIGSETKCVKFYEGRGMYSRDAAVTDPDGYYALPTHLPGWHQPTLDCIGCHLPYGTKDLDNDGVADRIDQCLGTSADAVADPTTGCSPDQDPSDIVISDHEKRDRQGKNMFYQYFKFDEPKTIDHGYLVNVPNSLGNYENARRVRVVPGSIYDSQIPGEEITLGLFYKQGLGGQGAPADAMLQLFKGGFAPENIVKKADGTSRVWNMSSATPLAYKPLPLPYLTCADVEDPTCVPTTAITAYDNPDYDVDHKGHKTPKVEEFVWTNANLDDESGWKLPLLDEFGQIVLDADGYPVIDEDEFGIPSVHFNPYENVFSTRLAIRGKFILIGFAHCVNWAAAKKAHDHYDYYVRWSTDGGENWSLPHNVSELKNHKETTSDPRVYLPPVKIGLWKYENGTLTYNKDSVEPEDEHNDNMFFVAIGTQENIPEPQVKDLEVKEAEVFLDATFTRAVKVDGTDSDFTFEKITKANPKYVPDSQPCLDPTIPDENDEPTPAGFNGTDADGEGICVAPLEDNPAYPESIDEFDWLAKGDAEQGDVQITCSPDATKLYGIYEQVMPIDEEEGQSHFQGHDIWLRKITYAKVPGDITGNLVVNMDDYSAMAEAFNTCQGEPDSNMVSDLNGDKCTTADDYTMWTNLYLLDGVAEENFKSKNMKKVFSMKLNQVLDMIAKGKFTAAKSKLQTDIIDKTNGCAASGKPDGDDWITDCQIQNQFYQFGKTTIEMLN
ncbi:MAG: choice-of-anchor O protein [Pseudomonadota bacterium]